MQIIDDLNRHVQRYLFVLLSGVFGGVLTWLAFALLSVEQAGLWSVTRRRHQRRRSLAGYGCSSSVSG